MKAQVRDLAGDARQGAEAFAAQHKSEGADRLQDVAETVSRVADDVAEKSPAMADFVRKAADGLEGVSKDLKNKSVGELLDYAKSFARREPAAFLAASAAAGFALSRILKSSASATGGAVAPSSLSSTTINPTGPAPFEPAGGPVGRPDALRPSSPMLDKAASPTSPKSETYPFKPDPAGPTPGAPLSPAATTSAATKPGVMGDKI